MIIERAIEKAREMQRARAAAEEQSARGAPAPLPRVGERGQDRGEPRSVEAQIREYRELKRVVLDPDTCERSRILYTRDGQSRLSRADPAYRVLRSRVQHRIAAGKYTSIGITSPGPGDGKTVTALNLAISLVREKQRPVFLLDLDMRNPTVLSYVGVTPPVQISQYFTGSAAPEDVLFATNLEMLVLAGNSHPVEGASELLADQRFDELMAYIHRRSPEALTVIDLPPVTSTDEALKVAPRVSAMFMVVSECRTRRDELTRSLNLLSDFKVAGIILNRSIENVGHYYYGY